MSSRRTEAILMYVSREVMIVLFGWSWSAVVHAAVRTLRRFESAGELRTA
jgi:hypothetical protein